MANGTPDMHRSKRKRVTWTCEPYPHPNKLIRLLDFVMMTFGFAIAAATVPQAWIIWSHQSAEDVSFISWSVYLLNACLYLIYALVHRERPILFGSFLLIVVNAAIVVGILLYG